jgi:hypothetical protein
VRGLETATVFSGSEQMQFTSMPYGGTHWAELCHPSPGQPRRLVNVRLAPPDKPSPLEAGLIDIAAIVDDLRDTARQLVEQLNRDEIDPDFLHALQVFFGQLGAALEDVDGIENKTGVYHEAGRLRGYILPARRKGVAVIFEIAPEDQVKELARLAAEAVAAQQDAG